MGLTTEPTVRETIRPPKRWPFSLADSRLNPWRGLGGLPREVWLLFATNLINRAGMMVLPFLVLYLTRELGFSLARAGSMLAVYGASAIVFGPIGGRLSDRIGALPIMRVALVGSGLVLLLFPLAKSFAAVAAMTILWAGCGEMFRPASLAAITHVVAPDQRRQAFALNRLAINLGMSIGPALGGFLATVSFRAMFAVDAVTTLLAGTLLALMPWRAFSGVNSDRADYLGGGSAQLDWGRSHGQQVLQWFDVSKFTANKMGTFGNAGRYILRGPRFFNVDLGLLKGTKLTERVNLQIRAEFFDIFNNVNFQLPNGNLSSAQVGRITGVVADNFGLPNSERIVQFGLKLNF